MQQSQRADKKVANALAFLCASSDEKADEEESNHHLLQLMPTLQLMPPKGALCTNTFAAALDSRLRQLSCSSMTKFLQDRGCASVNALVNIRTRDRPSSCTMLCFPSSSLTWSPPCCRFVWTFQGRCRMAGL